MTGDARLLLRASVCVVYPDTTTLYPATVVRASRRAIGSRTGDNVFIVVHIVDNLDEYGITHAKLVLMKHVTRPSKVSHGPRNI